MLKNTQGSTSSLLQASIELRSLQSKNNQSLNLQKISTLQKCSDSFTLPQIKQKIQKSYEDPFKEERFIEKDLSYYKVQKLNKNGSFKRNENTYMINKAKYIEEDNVLYKSSLQTPRGDNGIALGRQNSIHKESLESSVILKTKTSNDERVSPKQNGKQLPSNEYYSQFLPAIQDITQLYNSALVKKSKNWLLQQKLMNEKLKQQREKQLKYCVCQSFREQISEDFKINKNLERIKSILTSENKPFVQENNGYKFQKYFIGHKVPTYFHKQNYQS